MAGVIGLRGPDIDKRDTLRGYRVEWADADRPFIRPHTGAPVLTVDEDGPHVGRHVFGFSKRFTSFNARDDKLESGKMWSRYFAKEHHHGVVPVSYILEWADLGDGKRPWRIERADGAAMAVPALVGTYMDNKENQAFALVTVTPNVFIEKIHNRLIAQLDDADLDTWLAPQDHAPGELRACLSPGRPDDFVAYPLKLDAGKTKFDDASGLDAVGPAVSWADVKGGKPVKVEGGSGSRQATLGE